jgi:hypothetical protein
MGHFIIFVGYAMAKAKTTVSQAARHIGIELIRLRNGEGYA